MDPNISQLLSEAKRDIWKRPLLNQQIFYTIWGGGIDLVIVIVN